jgi:multiple sugar transport system permease protein
MTSRRETWLFYGFAGLAIVGFLCFALGPMLYSLYLSFTKFSVVQDPQWVGMANYSYLMSNDPAFWASVKVTLIYAVVSIPFSLALALGIALLLNAKVRFIGIYRTIYYLPSILPAVASTVVWVWIFSPEDGLLNNSLAAIGVDGPAWTSSTSWALPSMILMGLWGFGGAMVTLLAGLQDVPETLHEAAAIDGASRWHRLRHITIPHISPIIFFNLIMGIIGAMKIFDQAFVFGTASGQMPGGPARATLFYVLNLYQKAFNYFHFGLASAMAWLLFGLILVLTAASFWLGKRWVHYGDGR